MTRTLIETPWERLFVRKLSDVRLRLKIACPFIKTRYAKLLLASLPANEKLDVQILTRLKPQDILAGVHDLDALGALMAPLAGLNVQMRYLNRLHAKIFIFDAREAIVTSTNLTYAGFNTNAELGVSLTDEASVKTCDDHFTGLWSGAAEIRLDAILQLKDELRRQVEVAHREKFTVRLTSPVAQEESRSAFEAAVDNATVPDPTPLPISLREECLEAELPAMEVSEKDTLSRPDEKLLPDVKTASISEAFRNIFGKDISREDTLAVFAHASWLQENCDQRESVSLAKRQYLEVGFFALDLVTMRHILSSSRELSPTEELVTKRQYFKQTRWHAAALIKLGLGEPLLGRSLQNQVAGVEARIKYAHDILMGIFGWFAINHGTESLLAVSDVFFDFSEQLPYDFAAAIQHKSRLQELTQGTLGGKPEYSLSERKGPEHSPEFSVEIRLPGGRTFQGSGKTVKQAETAAAKNALHAIGITGRHVPDAKSRFIETPLPASFDTDQRRKLEDFWRTVIQRFSDRPFDWGWALAMACSFATLNQTRPARLRARMSCFGSTVIHYYASLALVTLWRKAREASPTHAEFMPSLCSHPALERFFDQLGLQRFIVETARLKTPACRTKVETMQAIMGYLFVARGESQARNFFKEFGKPSKQGVPIHK